MPPGGNWRSSLVRRFALPVALLAGVAVLAVPSSATFSGRNGRITFFKFVEKTNSVEVFSSRPNGRDLKKLTNSGARHASLLSDWSPNAHKIGFDSDRVDRDGRKDVVQVYVMNADGSHERQLTRGPGFHGMGGWSPDSKTLAIESDWGRARLQGIWLIPAIDRNGVRRKDARRVTNGPPPPGFDSEPQFSPNGRTIVFTRFKDERHSAIFRVQASGRGLKRLTPFRLNNSDPDWAPNGRLITFDSGDAGRNGSKGDIYVIRPGGGGLRRLTDRPRVTEGSPFDVANNPVFSPSGTRIMYTQFLEERTVLMMMRTDGSGKHAAVELSGFPNKVDWGSRP